jgi:hypothetical protein
MTKLTEEQQHDKVVNLSEIANNFRVLKGWMRLDYMHKQSGVEYAKAMEAHHNADHVNTERDLNIAQKRHDIISQRYVDYEAENHINCWTVFAMIDYCETEYHEM